MALQTTTDHAQITDRLDAAIARDPVRGTVLGTIGMSLEPTAWLAWDADAVAARSAHQWAVAVVGDWAGAALIALGRELATLSDVTGLSGARAAVDTLVDRPGASVATSMDQRLFRLDELWVDRDGTPVSLAVRRPVVGGSARVGPVYTPPTLRGHGYGSGVTAAATRSILDEDAIPVLFTDLANPTSNKIYRAMGYRVVEDQVVIRLA